jgi:AcrR family transcriptional regulator
MSTKNMQRKTQERTEVTRGKLLDAAAKIFSEQGYDGVSIRDLETSADVQRGLLAYHFGDKESLWKAATDRVFGILQEEVSGRFEIMRDLPPRERLAALVRFYVRFSASHPEFSRLLTQEARQDSWRNDYLIDTYIRDLTRNLRGPVAEVLGLGEAEFIHWFYMLAGASSLIFSHAPECRVLFKTEPLQESVVEAHADLMVKMMIEAFENGD